jgi:chromosomal replication initiator protein
MSIKDPEQLWRTTLAQIEVKIDSPAQYKTFFQGTKLVDIESNRATISVANAYMSDWLKQKYDSLIRSTISHVYGQPMSVEYKVDPDYRKGQVVKLNKGEILSTQSHPLSGDENLLAMQGGMHYSVAESIAKAGLNDKYTLQNYVVGNANQIAYAAAQAVVQQPGVVYNPLFIHGTTGVGKTHLAQAVGRAILEQNPKKKVVYTSSEGFLNDMVKSLRTQKQFEFRNRYRAVNVLIIDDIQLISKWVGTQDEFFNTFNELHNNQAQVIMVSDRPPSEIKDLQDRLRSRFQGGIVVDIQNPDLEMRMAILEKRNQVSGLDLPGYIIETVARGTEDNVRELEGNLQKVALFNQMKPNGDLTIEEINKIIGNDPRSKREKIKVPEILKETAREFGVAVKELKGERRTKVIALARQTAMYVLREEFEYNLDEVAGFVNRSDHTTVIHAVDKIKSLILTEEGFKEQVVRIIKNLNEGVNSD